ncbi:MAG: SEL1-like repeat protein [Muribaculaceae bacterium]|nr:SEL1-like repeat protein [Muribaculaceae bacterium]
MNELKQGTPLQGGKYIIKRVLGQGGFGITYLAEQVSLGREVAIKEFFMKDNCVRNEETGGVTVPTTGSAVQVKQYRKKFLKEARTLASLAHPNIVSVIDVFEENGTVYYSMPFLPGGSLNDVVKSTGRLPEREALHYIQQVAEALKYLHEEKHLCHYDVKPANILLDSNGNPVLIDFGISKNYDSQGNETSSTPVGMSEGFAPIEQYQHLIAEFSPASDVYALGATLYFLVTGTKPPTAVSRVSGEELKFDDTVSHSVKDIIIQSMRTSMRDRAQSIDLFIQTPSQNDATLSFANDEALPQSQQSFLIKVKEDRTPKSKKRFYKRVIIASIASLVLSVASVGLFEHFYISSEEQYQIGKEYYEQQDYDEAIKWFRKAAERGDAKGQNGLGIMYENGQGVPQDYAEAIKWYRKAAEQGDANGQNNLGAMCENGRGVPQDYTEAVRWYRKAAEQGDANGQNSLGIMYADGQGVPQDYAEAIKWFRKAAEQGDAYGQNSLGVMYDNGRGVPQDYAEAIKWFRKAAEQGNAYGQNNLGIMYENGQGVPQDYAEAIKWYRKAAEQGDANGQNSLGDMYYNGHGVKKSYTEAIKWFKKSAEQGNAYGQYSLGYMYENAEGIYKDISKAREWYKKAAEQGNQGAIDALKGLN